MPQSPVDKFRISREAIESVGGGEDILISSILIARFYCSLLQEVSRADSIISVNLSDTFFTNLTATSTTTAIYFIENVSQGYAAAITVSGGPTLCQTNAEWDVENPGGLDTPVFTDVIFTNCLATTTTGAQQGIDGTTLIYMDSKNGEISKGLEIDDSQLRVFY
ncbi:hypothetical protein F5882DRAFT_376788 [Hyaloscypha sp. PMI_1271]|nr:hypothetical protein F5882DRAFT_376788 [Hyaloscypha sp. PMI_1271]